MKGKLIFALALFAAVLLFSCEKPGVTPKEAALDAALLKDTTLIEFVDSTTFYFDTIQQGDKVEHIFHIKNVGDKNLLIGEAHGDCGCTVPEYPKEPVKPGDVAEIKVTFNSAGKHDDVTKTVTMTCNTPAHREHLYLKGFVKTDK